MKSFLVLVILVGVALSMQQWIPSTPLRECGANGDQPTPYCSNTNCGNNQTCCTLDNGNPGCCEGTNATCCGLNNECCPSGYVCDPINHGCVPAHVNETKSCSLCAFVINAIETKGCNGICAILPGQYKAICAAIVATGVCNWINTNETPQQVCSAIGLCGAAGACKCGYCTRYVHDRCLSLPNKCPSSSAHAQDPVTHPLRPGPLGCADGACDSSSYGCCLTCF